jgi:archaellum component FlaC
MRKSDPNSRPPKVEPMMGNFSQFDKNLIRSKVIELKSKYKKGKIIYEEYERELNNFRKQYPGDLDEVEE